jgi:hypothetical protein
MHIERLEKLASEKVDVSLNQKRAELLRHRIEELDRLLGPLEKPLDGVRFLYET